MTELGIVHGVEEHAAYIRRPPHPALQSRIEHGVDGQKASREVVVAERAAQPAHTAGRLHRAQLRMDVFSDDADVSAALQQHAHLGQSRLLTSDHDTPPARHRKRDEVRRVRVHAAGSTAKRSRRRVTPSWLHQSPNASAPRRSRAKASSRGRSVSQMSSRRTDSAYSRFSRVPCGSPPTYTSYLPSVVPTRPMSPRYGRAQPLG